MEELELDERKTKILNAIIRNYLEKGPCVHKLYIEEKIILRDSFRSLAAIPQTN